MIHHLDHLFWIYGVEGHSFWKQIFSDMMIFWVDSREIPRRATGWSRLYGSPIMYESHETCTFVYTHMYEKIRNILPSDMHIGLDYWISHLLSFRCTYSKLG